MLCMRACVYERQSPPKIKSLIASALIEKIKELEISTIAVLPGNCRKNHICTNKRWTLDYIGQYGNIGPTNSGGKKKVI